MLSRAQRGFSLVELLIAMTLGLFLLSGVLYLFTSLLDMNVNMLHRQRLQQELRALMSVMIHDIRRAGYWAPTGLSSAPNPFAAYRIAENGHCLLYGYDGDDNGVADANERTGYKLSAGTVRVTRQAPSCGGRFCDNCDNGRWWQLSDPAVISITRLEFREIITTLHITKNKPLHLPALHIHLAGKLRHFPTERLTLEATVQLPNTAPRP